MPATLENKPAQTGQALAVHPETRYDRCAVCAQFGRVWCSHLNTMSGLRAGCGVPGAGVYEAIEELYHFYSVVASTA